MQSGGVVYTRKLTEHALDTRELGNVLDDHASGGEHAHAAVLKLGLAEPPDIDEVADAKGVEANVASLCIAQKRVSNLYSYTRALVLPKRIRKENSPMCRRRPRKWGARGNPSRCTWQ